MFTGQEFCRQVGPFLFMMGTIGQITEVVELCCRYDNEVVGACHLVKAGYRSRCRNHITRMMKIMVHISLLFMLAEKVMCKYFNLIK